MGHHSRAVERRLVSLERRPIRLCWTICAAFAFPALPAALIGIAGVNLGIVAP